MFVLASQKLPDFSNVAAGSTATLNVPVGNTYHAINLGLTIAGVPATVAQIAAQVSRVTVKVNAALKINLTATQIQRLNLFYGAAQNVANVDGVLRLDLAPNWLEDVSMRFALAWGTANVDDFTIEVQLAAGATIDRVSAWGVVDTTPRLLGYHREVLTYARNVAATGEYEENNLNTYGRASNVAYKAVHVPRTGAPDITELSVYVTNRQLVNALPYYINEAQLAITERTAQTGYYSVCFDTMDSPINALQASALADFRIVPTYGVAPGNQEWVTEVYKNIPDSVLNAGV